MVYLRSSRAIFFQTADDVFNLSDYVVDGFAVAREVSGLKTFSNMVDFVLQKLPFCDEPGLVFGFPEFAFVADLEIAPW